MEANKADTDTADHSNKQEELEQKATKPNKGEESSMENLGGSEGVWALTKPTYDLDRVWEWAEEQIIPNKKQWRLKPQSHRRQCVTGNLIRQQRGQNQSSAL